jgi:hypothetical protein
MTTTPMNDHDNMTTMTTTTSVSTHYIDLLCAAADAMHQAALTPKQMVAAMCVIAATYAMKEDDNARI